MLDDVFALLESAKHMERSGNRIEAATKYYESCYLMRQVLFSMPQDVESEPTRRLLSEQIESYTTKAQSLYFDDSSTAPSKNQLDTRSPLSTEDVLPPRQSRQNPPPPPPISSTIESPRFTQSANLNKIARQANMKLAQAIELDEKAADKTQAIATYMKAAELFLQAIRSAECNSNATAPGERSSSGFSSSSSLVVVLKRRLEGAMDRIEQLQRPNQRHIFAMSKTKDAATVSTTSDGSSLLIGKAAKLSTEEIAILKRSSKIDSGLFLPWSEDEAEALSLHVQNLLDRGSSSSKSIVQSSWKDPSGDLGLSDKQKRKFYKWARPMEISNMRNASVRQKHPVMIRRISPYTIRQAYVTDCSFIASLCICSLFEKRFGKRLVTSIIYPQDKHGVPMYNPEGKYYVKLWLNGVARVVIVDDYFPIDKYSNLLCSHTSSSAQEDRKQLELWVSVIEKAYMKLSGGYNFPGSNSGNDLFSLTGWIPERIFFPRDPERVRDFETPAERAWDRISSAASFGDCLITVSTTRDMTEDQADALGLVTGHAYAVLHVVETGDGTRLLQLKNPWQEKRFKGKYSPHDQVSWNKKGLASELQYNPHLAAKEDDGIFWIGWDDVLSYFQNIQLSWNPALFSFRMTTHGLWPKNQGVQNDAFNVGENPQYIVAFSDEALEKKPTIWILISRHTNKIDEDDDSYLTIHVVRSGAKKRIWYPHSKNTVVNGAYTNNPHVLVRYDVASKDDRYLSLVLSQHDKKKDIAYTLSTFCTEPFLLGRPSRLLKFSRVVRGRWTTGKLGGSVGATDFFQNPIFAITIEDSSAVIQLRCSTAKTIPVNIMVLEVPAGTPLTSYRSAASGKPILDTGNYRHAFVVTEPTPVPAGSYMVVVSTWSRQEGEFTLCIGSSCEIQHEIVEIP
jgi:calpain-7